MALNELDAASLAELVDAVLTLSKGQLMWFRGQGCGSYKLEPKLVRKVTPFTVDSMLAAEKRLITRFRQRSLPLWPEGYPQDDWEQLFFMQHFGVPTRLLDWTENALAAAYFAADHSTDLCKCGTKACQPYMWALAPGQLNAHNPRFHGMDVGVLATSEAVLDAWSPAADAATLGPDPVALYGTHNSPRIVAQQGTFTVVGKNVAPLESGDAVIGYDDVLWKITLRMGHAEILEKLNVLGVRRTSIFPDLSSLAAELTEMEFGA